MSEALAKKQYTPLMQGEEPIYNDLSKQIAIVASMYSFLRNLGLVSDDVREHLYDLLALWTSQTPYTYIEGLIELASYKRREIDYLIDLYGEDGLGLILRSLENSVCNTKDEIETLTLLMEDLGVKETLRAKIMETAKSSGCRGIKSASIALLITPAKG